MGRIFEQYWMSAPMRYTCMTALAKDRASGTGVGVTHFKQFSRFYVAAVDVLVAASTG
jgi:hypothetical protein